MTTITASFLDVIAADETEKRTASRKAVVAAKQRVEDSFGNFLAQHGIEGFDHVADDIGMIVHAAANEYGASDVSQIFDVIRQSYIKPPTPKEASIHESRKPKMCPFHSDVVGISLAQGEAKAGFEAMAQHWGGPKHCQGEGYEGSKCNFKPQMTTQAFWDERAEKAEQRKQDRAEQQEEVVNDTVETPEAEVGDEVSGEPTTEETPATETIETEPEGAEVIPFPTSEPSAVGEGTSDEIPMSMAASKTADKDVTGLGDTETPIDKRKWTPQTVPFLDVDDDDGRWPTRHKDIIEPIKPANGDELTEIGEQVTEHVDLPSSDNAGFSDGGPTKAYPTKTFPGTGQADPVTSAAIPDDVDKNPITALVNGEYDGFLPSSVVQQAIAAARS